MRDMKGGRGRSSNQGGERIEPRIDVLLADVSEKPVRRRSRVTETIQGSSESGTKRQDIGISEGRVVRDVLLESSASATVGASATGSGASIKRERGYAKVTPQGRLKAAAPQKARWTLNFSWWNRKLAVVVFIGLLLVGGYWISEPLVRLLERPIKSVVVEGEFHFITKERATDLISQEIDGDFLQLDLMRLKSALLSDPWVESVALNRRWPDTLVVKIAEQKPIARWGNGFLNQRGEIVRVDAGNKLLGLPWLQGNESDASEILQQYQDLSQLLRSRGLEVVALKCDNKKSWRLTIKNAVEIAIGRDQVMEKMRRFVTVYDTHLSNVWNDVKAIDIRYSNGVAVRWNDGSEMAKKYIKSYSH